MGLVSLAWHAGAAAGLVVAVLAAVRYGSDSILRLVAGLTAIIARSDRPRAERALDVLNALRRDRQLSPPGDWKQAR